MDDSNLSVPVPYLEWNRIQQPSAAPVSIQMDISIKCNDSQPKKSSVILKNKVLFQVLSILIALASSVTAPPPTSAGDEWDSDSDEEKTRKFG